MTPSKDALAARARRRRKGERTESEAAQFSRGLQRAVQLPLLESLADAGGRARPRDVYDRVADALSVDQAALDATRDCADGRSYKIFQQQVRWSRQTAVTEGLIAGERGTWELTDAAYAKLGRIRRGAAVLLYRTDTGIALWAHAEDAASHIDAGSVKLVLTSPPYPVVRREYGRFTVPEWLSWMRDLTAIWKTLISPDGTIAVNLMDAYVSGFPVLSPYIERFTLAAIDDVGLHLAGRMMWHSPNKLGNLQWTSKERLQPKNSLEHVLLFSKTPRPSWDINRMDRRDYAPRSAAALRADAARGKSKRPAGYDLNEAAFRRDEHGPLPGNLIIATGAHGADDYSRKCRAAGIAPHPARFPDAVPRQVIQLTSEPGDIVYDPMAGSNTTGKIAADLGRRWIASEPMLEYARSSALRFGQEISG